VAALKLAKEVAAEGGALVAGDICNTNIYIPDDPKTHEEARAMFAEQVGWAKEAGVDFIICETIDFLGEAMIALEEVLKAGLPAVVTLATHKSGMMRDGPSAVEACVKLANAGASVVGFNCSRGPSTMLPLLKELRKAVSIPIAALPVGYNTNPEKPTMQTLIPIEKCYLELEPYVLTRFQVAEFTQQCIEIGVNYMGLCCGGAPYMIRAMAEQLGRQPPASEFSPDLSKHFSLGNHPSFKTINTDFKFDANK